MTTLSKAKQIRGRYKRRTTRTKVCGCKALHIRYDQEAYGDRNDYLVIADTPEKIASLKQSARYSGFHLHTIPGRDKVFHVSTWHSIGD